MEQFDRLGAKQKLWHEMVVVGDHLQRKLRSSNVTGDSGYIMITNYLHKEHLRWLFM